MATFPAAFARRALATPARGFAVLTILALLVYGSSAAVRAVVFGSGPSDQTHYAYLAESMLEGRIDIEPSHAPWLIELVPVDGRHYVVYPPMPAVLLTPFVAAFGPTFPTTILSIALAAFAVGCTFVLTRRLYFSVEVAGLTAVLLGFGTPVWYAALRGSSWQLAHVVAVFFLLLALLEVHGRRRGLPAGLFLGAAYFARIPVVLATPYLLWALTREGSRRERARRAILCCVGVGAFIALNMSYNWVRYGTVVDASYLLIPDVLNEPWFDKGFLDLTYIPRNIYAIALQPPAHVAEFPYFIPNEFGTSLLFVTPALFLMFLAPNTRRTWITAAATLLVATPALIKNMPGWTQYGYRYALDYLPFLMILTALGISALASSRMDGRVPLRVYGLVGLSCLASVWGLVFAEWVDPHWLFSIDQP